MRHKVKKIKLGTNKEHTVSILRNLAAAVLIHEKIETTEKRAKAVVPIVEKAMTIAKTHDLLNAIRQLEKLLQHKNSSKKVIEELTKRYKDRNSGFTRMQKIGYRKGDNAMLVQLELIS